MTYAWEFIADPWRESERRLFIPPAEEQLRLYKLAETRLEPD